MNIEKKAKGVYYLNQVLKKAEINLIEFLINEATNEKLNMARCCLHENEESLLMSMVIVVMNKYTYPAHKHNWKDESYTILRGQCEYQEFDDEGNLLCSSILSENETLLNTNRNFHLLKPHTKIMAFIETTIGPFKGNNLKFLKKLNNT
jgi:cupin fold WbuC family metalloprotein